MTALQGDPDPSGPDIVSTTLVQEDPDLGSRYEEYCRRQAKGLVSILPKEAIRPLYARAREWGRNTGQEVVKDPLATFILFLRDLIPLPPRDVWEKDRAENLDAHVKEEFDSPPAHRRSSPPVTVESRGMEMEGRRWRATLNLFRRDEAWRGFIVFNLLGEDETVRTTDIFREEDPDEIRNRFLGFHNQTLQAFLRSVLP
ncbi:MAG: hypothetical protein MUO50_11840 [Longimicrobiales bacterium]|nr:hypothetical protein [Longimicrobiales bacterium]